MKETVLNAGRILRDYYISQYGSNITDANINRLCSVATDLIPGEKYGQIRSILSLCQRYQAFKKYTESNLEWTARAKSVLHIMQNDAMLAKNFALCAVVLVVMICDGKEEGEKHAIAIISPNTPQPQTQPQPQNTQPQPTAVPVQTRPTQTPTQPQANNSKPQGATEEELAEFEISDGVLIKYKGERSHVVIPNCVTTIKSAAFYRLPFVVSVYIPASVTCIQDYAFFWCEELSIMQVAQGNEVYYDNRNCIIDRAKKSVAVGCVGSIIPSDGSVVSIGKNAFFGCIGLKNINIPSTIIKIEDSAFGECSNLETIIIPNSVKVIEKHAFYKCVALKSITLPIGLASIEYGTFSDCKNLTDVIIPDSVTNIGYGAFWSCASLKSIKIPNSVTRIDDKAFSYCSSLASVTLPDNVSMGTDVFYLTPVSKV